MAPLLRLLLLLLGASAVGAADIVLTAGSDLLRAEAAERSRALAAVWQPTPAALTDGPVVLAEAVAALTRAGNPTSLAPGVDGSRSAAVSVTGDDYWSALLALCDAFALEPAPGLDAGVVDADTAWRNDAATASAIPLSAGPVVLVPRSAETQPCLRQASGVLLIEVRPLALVYREGGERRWLEATLHARVEPRIDPRSCGAAPVAWQPATVLGQPLAKPRPRSGTPGELVLEEAPAGGVLHLSGRIDVEVLETVRVEHALAFGDSLAIALGAQRATIRLRDPAGAGRTGDGVGLSHPAGVLVGAPDLAVRVGERLLRRAQPGLTAMGNTYEWLLRVELAAEAEHVVSLQARVPLATVPLPIRIALDLDALPTTARAPSPGTALLMPTRVVLPGGDLRLDQALAALRTGGNTVLVDLGVDGAARAQVPAIDASFWEAALTIADAFGLAVLANAEPTPADQAHDRRRGRQLRAVRGDSEGPASISGGTLRLGRARGPVPAARRVCGSLLVEASDLELHTNRTLAGVARQARLRLRVRLEPRVPLDLIDEASIALSSQTSSGAQVSLIPADKTRANPDDAERTATPLVLVDGVAAGASSVELAGHLTVRARRPLRGEAGVSVAAPVQLGLGGTSITLSLSPDSGDQPGGLTISSVPGSVQDLTLVLRDGAGRALPQRGRSMRPHGRRQEETWQFAGISDEGSYQATVTGYEPLAQPVLPIAVSVPLP